jgi:hypothetical protein
MGVASAILLSEVKRIAIPLLVSQSGGVTRECLKSGVSEFSGLGWC